MVGRLGFLLGWIPGRCYVVLFGFNLTVGCIKEKCFILTGFQSARIDGHQATLGLRSLVVKLSRWARDDFTNKKTLKRMLVSEMKVGKLLRLQDVLMAVDAEDA